MSIAEKLNIVAENTPKVFNAGYEKGKAEQSNLFDYVTSLSRTFIYCDFPIGTELELTVGKKTNFRETEDFFNNTFYRAKGIKRIKISDNIDLPNRVFFLNSTFEGESGNSDKDFLEIIDLSKIKQPMPVANLSRTFYARKKLKKIIGTFDLSQTKTTQYAFGLCEALEEVRFTPNTIKISISFSSSPDLTDESIEAIVNGYADMTGQTSPVLTVHPNVKAKIEANSEWLNTLINKNVTLA